MSEVVNVLAIIVDHMPDSCGKCPIMQYANDFACCVGLPTDVWKLTGNPYDMHYRRSDCPLQVDKTNCEKFF